MLRQYLPREPVLFAVRMLGLGIDIADYTTVDLLVGYNLEQTVDRVVNMMGYLPE